jgi:amylosucrase
MLNLANKGVDVFRLDAVPFLWKREDTNCQSEPELHKILQLMRVALNKVAPSAAFMAESCQEPEELIEYFGEEQPEVNLAYNFDLMGAFWHAIATGKVNKMSEILKEIEDLPPQVWWSVFTECHDEVTFQLCNAEERRQIWDVFKEDAEPFRQREGESVPWGMCGTTYSLLKDVRKVLLMEAVKFSLPGLPLLYMGEELAVENDYSFRDDPQKAADRRFLKRVQLSDQVRAERSDEGPAKEIFQGIKKLIEWRKRNQLVGNNFNVVDTHNEHVLGFSYHQEKKGLFCFANFSNKKQSIKINDGNGGELVVELNPYQFKSEKISAE